MKVADIGEGDLRIRCPECRRELFCLGYNLRLRLPADMLLTRYVARHICQQCSRRGRKVRCEGWIYPTPGSGAEPGKPQGEYPF
jgi:hypothetical protein